MPQGDDTAPRAWYTSCPLPEYIYNMAFAVSVVRAFETILFRLNQIDRRAARHHQRVCIVYMDIFGSCTRSSGMVVGCREGSAEERKNGTRYHSRRGVADN
jgi:hypothetical protein